jgi:thioredoxin reductase (NADPH)
MNRIEEGAIAAFFNAQLVRIDPGSITFRSGSEPARTIPNDVVLALTGYRPDYMLLEALGIASQDDQTRTPSYDAHTFESNRPGVFLAGTVCGGLNTSRWFIENGRFHASRIAAELADR